MAGVALALLARGSTDRTAPQDCGAAGHRAGSCGRHCRRGGTRHCVTIGGARRCRRWRWRLAALDRGRGWRGDWRLSIRRDGWRSRRRRCLSRAGGSGTAAAGAAGGAAWCARRAARTVGGLATTGGGAVAVDGLAGAGAGVATGGAGRWVAGWGALVVGAVAPRAVGTAGTEALAAAPPAHRVGGPSARSNQAPVSAPVTPFRRVGAAARRASQPRTS